MTDQYLMKKDGHGQMNVKPEKLDEYLADGWVVAKKPQDNRHVVVNDQPAPEPASVSTETAPVKDVEAAVEKVEKKTKGKK